jgi:molecular chaperone GrpE
MEMPHSRNEGPAPEECADAETLAAENASLRDRILRALADAENTRRRAERTVHDTSKYAIADFAGELLAVPDNLQRTIAAAGRHSPERVEDAALLEGVRATERALMRALALGAPFDPAVHEAVREGDDGSYPPGSIARVLEDGYITCRSRRRREAPLE